MILLLLSADCHDLFLYVLLKSFMLFLSLVSVHYCDFDSHILISVLYMYVYLLHA